MEPAPAPSTSLLDAIKSGNAARVAALAAQEPHLLRVRTAEGVSPVMLAMYSGKPEIARLLVDCGSLPDLFEASATGLIERVREIVDADPAQVDAVSIDGFPPLTLACFFGHLEVVQLLLGRGAAVNTPSTNAMRVCPLHSAAARNDVGIVEMLLVAGADPNAKQQMGFTALHAAAQSGNSELVEMLLAAGADPDARADDGRSAAQCAAARGHDALASRLTANGSAV